MTEDAKPQSQTPMREALASLRASAELLSKKSFAPAFLESTRALDVLAAAGATPAAPGVAVLEEARRRLVAAAPSRFADAARRDLSQAPWLLWSGSQPMIGVPGLLQAVLHHAERSGATRRRLIEAWMLDFSPDRVGVEAGAQAIRRFLSGDPDRRLQSWRDAEFRFRLFSPREGPSSVAAAVLDGSPPVTEVLRAACLEEPKRAGSGYARAVQEALLLRLGPALAGSRGSDVFVRAKTFLETDGRLRFNEPQAWGAIARNLLAPWLTGGTQPSEALRASVQHFLLHHLLDPRLHPHKWKEAGEHATSIVRGWLGRATFRTFFRLIDEMASDRQWRHREAFWSAYLDRDLIQDVWLALGSTIHTAAKAKLKGDFNSGYASLQGDANQAILLFRIGGLVFCEWSNSGALRAWPVGARNAPKLYEPAYNAFAVKTASLSFDGDPGSAHAPALRIGSGKGLYHNGGETGKWQTKAARFLAAHTGVQLFPRDWMPKARR